MELTKYQKTIIKLALEEYLMLFVKDNGRDDLVKEIHVILEKLKQ